MCLMKRMYCTIKYKINERHIIINKTYQSYYKLHIYTSEQDDMIANTFITLSKN